METGSAAGDCLWTRRAADARASVTMLAASHELRKRCGRLGGWRVCAVLLQRGWVQPAGALGGSEGRCGTLAEVERSPRPWRVGTVGSGCGPRLHVAGPSCGCLRKLG